jgi:hypothetical protein
MTTPAALEIVKPGGRRLKTIKRQLQVLIPAHLQPRSSHLVPGVSEQ